MSERLIIRVGNQLSQPIDWAVWSQANQELIASGEFPNADALQEIKSHATSRPITLLIPASDCVFKTLTLPRVRQRIQNNALLYQLEDELATDVDGMHLVVCGRQREDIHIIAVSMALFDLWIQHFAQLGLSVRAVLPDVLALPLAKDAWSAIQIREQWLVRQDRYQGVGVEETWLPALLDSFEHCASVHYYSPKPTNGQHETWLAQPFELPMKLLAKGCENATVNLLTGAYRPESALASVWKTWRKVTLAAACLFVLSITTKLVDLYKLNTYQQTTKTQINTVAKRILPPDTRIVSVQSQVSTYLKQLKIASQRDFFLEQLTHLEPALQQAPQLDLLGLTYDGTKQQITLKVFVPSYDTIDKFTKQAQTRFVVELGNMQQQEDAFVGTIRLRNLS